VPTLFNHSDDSCVVHSEQFDGPLELLLFIVRQQGVDIRTMCIAPITDAFMAHLSKMEADYLDGSPIAANDGTGAVLNFTNAVNLDLAGEFLVMASTLCLLKSRELIPQVGVAHFGEEEDPAAMREALVQQLHEYARYKDAADQLQHLPWLGRDTFSPIVQSDECSTREIDTCVDAIGLLNIFHDVLDRNSQEPLVHKVTREQYSLEEMSGWLLDQTYDTPRDLQDLLAHFPDKSERVVCFLAALEMGKLQLLELSQNEHLGPVLLRAKESKRSANLSAISGGVS